MKKIDNKLGILVAAVLLGAVLAGGNGLAGVKSPTLSSSDENPLMPMDRPFDFTSQEGDFQITWPGGCGKLRTRSLVDDGTSQDKEHPVFVSCDRNGEEGEGCSVSVLFNVKGADGGPAGPAEVVARMESMLVKFGAEIKRQAPLKKDFGDGLVVEGLDLQAAQTGGAGQVWLRGLLVYGDIYILAAWDLGGQLWGNPEYATFFNSFKPGTE
jgi:hypothetical protein